MVTRGSTRTPWQGFYEDYLILYLKKANHVCWPLHNWYFMGIQQRYQNLRQIRISLFECFPRSLAWIASRPVGLYTFKLIMATNIFHFFVATCRRFSTSFPWVFQLQNLECQLNGFTKNLTCASITTQRLQPLSPLGSSLKLFILLSLIYL